MQPLTLPLPNRPFNGIIVSLLVAISVAATAHCFAKALPAGVVNLNNGQITPQNTIGNLAKHPWANPNISGVRVKTLWNYAQSSATTYSWTGIDEALRLAGVYHKFIGLSVTAGVNTPQWVYDSGATRYPLRDGSNLAMPLPWEDAFLNPWLAFVHELGARYDGNPNLQYVVISGLGQTMETYLAKTSADAAALTALGGQSAWVTAGKRIITAYAEAFPTTPFFITMAMPFPSTDARPKWDLSLLAEQELVTWAIATYPGRFGVMTACLNAHSNTGFWPNYTIYMHQASQPTGFQMLAANIKDNGLHNMGPLSQALTNGVNLGGNFVEVYEGDVNDPRQQSVLAAQNAALKAAAGH